MRDDKHGAGGAIEYGTPPAEPDDHQSDRFERFNRRPVKFAAIMSD
jgi:hypothetical protein